MLSGAVRAQLFHEGVGTTKEEYGFSVQFTTTDKGYIAAGVTSASVFGNQEATLVRTKLDGSIVWSAVYGQARNEVFNSVREVPFTTTPNLKPGFAALGTTTSFAFGAEDIYFVRTDLNGTPIFSRALGGAKTDRGYCLQYIKDSSIGYGYVLVGETQSYPYFAGTDVYVAKLDEFGNLVQATVIGGEGDESGYWIEQTRDGGFIIAGSTTTRACVSTVVNSDIFVIKLKSDLTLDWNRIIGGKISAPYTDIGYGVVENPLDGSFTITGFTNSFDPANRGDAFLLNLSAAGGFNWFKTYGLSGAEQGNSLHVERNATTGELEYVVAGSSTSYNTAAIQQAYMFKTDALGNLKWTGIYAEKYAADAREVIASGEDGYVFAGRVEPFVNTHRDIYLVKSTVDGKTGDCDRFVDQKEIRQDVCINASAQQVRVDQIKAVETLVKYVDYAPKKCPVVAVAAEDADAATAEVAISPNPTQDKLYITREADAQPATVRIFNQQGVLVSEQAIAGAKAEVSVSTLRRDVYVIHVIGTDGTTSRLRFVKE